MKNIKDTLIEEISKGDVIKNIEYVKQVMHDISPLKSQPVNRIKWVPIDEVTPNDYNPNSVAKKRNGTFVHVNKTRWIYTTYRNNTR
jgi:hypothetical protein